jgi:hypothetical protein
MIGANICEGSEWLGCRYKGEKTHSYCRVSDQVGKRVTYRKDRQTNNRVGEAKDVPKSLYGTVTSYLDTGGTNARTCKTNTTSSAMTIIQTIATKNPIKHIVIRTDVWAPFFASANTIVANTTPAITAAVESKTRYFVLPGSIVNNVLQSRGASEQTLTEKNDRGQ